jgi:hypothetical protein
MGYEHVEKVLESGRYHGVAKAVLIALVHHINAKRAEKGNTEVWPGKGRLEFLSGWKETAVEKAVAKLVSDGVVEITKLGVGSETTHYFIHLDKLSGTEIEAMREKRGLRSDLPDGRKTADGGVSEGPVVGREATPKRGIGSGELKPEKKSGNSFSLSSGENFLLEPDEPKSNPQTSGTPSPNPSQEHTCPGPVGPFPAELPPILPSPRKESAEFIWTEMTKATRKAYFEQFPEEGRRAYKLETLFSAVTGKPSKAEDFQKLIDSGVNPPTIGDVIDWVVNKSDGHWEFHNSKHFCKDSVYPVVEEQYRTWAKKHKKAKKVAA